MSGRWSGFSFVELMVVLAIVAIVAALAVPVYGRYAYRARRVDGKELLWRIAEAQERYYGSYSRYGGLVELGFVEPVLSEKGFYRAVVRVGDVGAWFVAEVWPVSVQSGDVCGVLAVDDVGRRMPGEEDVAANGNGVCW